MTSRPCVVLTGGPGGGKTTLIEMLRDRDPQAARWLTVPEAAPLLFRCGLDSSAVVFERAVVRQQTAMEDSCLTAAQRGQMLVCHRGTLDALACWLRNGWEEQDFFSLTGLTREAHLARYYGVIHLQTAAIGAEHHYRRWPVAHRPESAAEAAAIDVPSKTS